MKIPYTFIYPSKPHNDTGSITVNGKLLVFGLVAVKYNSKRNAWVWIKKNFNIYRNSIQNLSSLSVKDKALMTSLLFFLACNKQYKRNCYFSYKIPGWKISHVSFDVADDYYLQTIVSIQRKTKRHAILSKLLIPLGAKSNLLFDTYLDISNIHLYAEDPNENLRDTLDIKKLAITKYLNFLKSFPIEISEKFFFDNNCYNVISLENSNLKLGIDNRLVLNPDLDTISNISMENKINTDGILVRQGIIIIDKDMYDQKLNVG